MTAAGYSRAESAYHSVMRALEGVPIQTPQLIGILLGCFVFLTTIGLVIFILVKSGTLAGAFKQMQEEAGGGDSNSGSGNAAHGAGSRGPTLFDRVIEKAASLPTKPAISTTSANKRRGKEKNEKKNTALSLHEVSVVPLEDKHCAALWAASNGGALFHESAYDARERIWKRLDLSPVSCAYNGSVDDDDRNGGDNAANNLCSMPHLAQPTKTWPCESVQSFQDWFAAAPADALHCAILDTSLDVPVGMVSLVCNRPYDLTIGISNMWLTPAYQSQSSHAGAPGRPKFAHFAGYLLVKELFSQGYRRITLQVPEKNNVMKKFANHCGFQLEGVTRKGRISQAASQDICVYSLVNAEWPAAELAWRIRLHLPREEKEKETDTPTQTHTQKQTQAKKTSVSNSSPSPTLVRRVPTAATAAATAATAPATAASYSRNDGGDEFRNALRGLLPDDLLDEPLPDMEELDVADM